MRVAVGCSGVAFGTEADRVRTATHEAGHAAAAYILGRRLGPVSIEPSAHFNGIAFSFDRAKTLTAAEQAASDRLDLPVVLLPARLRRRIETSVMVSLAGWEAARSIWPPETGYIPVSEDETRAEELARIAVLTSRGLPPSEAAMLEEAAQTETPTDEDQAIGVCLAWAAGDAAHYLSWLRAATAYMVSTSRFRRLVAAMVPELLTHRTLSGRRVRDILVAADEAGNAELEAWRRNRSNPDPGSSGPDSPLPSWKTPG